VDRDSGRAAEVGAHRALAAISHELASPLTALHTFLRLAKGEGLAPIEACVRRIEAAVSLAREVSHLEEPAANDATDLVLAFESAAARLALTVVVDAAGPAIVRVAMKRAVLIATSLLRGVQHAATASELRVRLRSREDRIAVRVDPGIEPASWRVVEPWESGTGFKLDLWAVAIMSDADVRVGDAGGEIAVELELPAAELR
jgi:signal transduction histidine kinase